MSAEVQDASLQKIDSAISDEPASPKEAKVSHRRTKKEGVELKIAPETQKLNWKLNTAPTSIDEKDVLKKLLVNPPVKKIDLRFPLGLEVTARNLKGVTIRDAMDAIHKQFKKKADDELEEPYLAGFEWDKEECYTRFIVHQKKTGEAPIGGSGGKKKKNKGGEE